MAIRRAMQAFVQFHLRGLMQKPSGVSTSTQAVASTKIGGVENLARRSSPSSTPNTTLRSIDVCFFQRTSPAATAKTKSAAAPSVVAREKCAIIGGEKDRKSTRLNSSHVAIS